ncbi:MAG: hypothetical protein RX318_03970 [bacterium]|nr:hypothetical protein [bacterium]
MPVTLVRTKWSSGKLQFTDTSGNVLFEIDGANLKTLFQENIEYQDEVVHTSVVKETISADKTLDAQDVGKILYVDTDAKTITLPSTVVGYVYTFVNAGADGAVAINISPAAADKIMGPDIAGVDNKDLINTKGTAKKGDRVTIIGDGSLGWYVVAPVHGTWAAEA